MYTLTKHFTNIYVYFVFGSYRGVLIKCLYVRYVIRNGIGKQVYDGF